jgi:NADPH-dependent 2,4-dienoyl-CoA reductase/sulfur reductase-like enzyme
MIVIRCDIAIVGAGPAGLSAAIAAADAGARVVVVDEYFKPGGQYFRQPQAQFTTINEDILGKSYQASKPIIEAVARHERIEVRTGSLAWGAFHDGVLELERDNVCERLASDRLIVATGAYERPIPFRGWILPGVTTAGAAQTMLKAQFVLPGRRTLMSGTGPFQLPVASQIVRAGGAIVEILEARARAAFFKPFARPWLHLDKLWEAQGYYTTLLTHGVPLRYGQTVIEARGDGRVEEAVIAPLDEQGQPLEQQARVAAVDSILTNFGFIPSLQLPRLLGCETVWDAAGCCWVASCDQDQRSSVQRVLLAGEVTGIAGHRVAMAEGEVAGRRAAADLGFLTETEFVRLSGEPHRRRARHQSFAEHVKRNFAPLPKLYETIGDDIVVCRCEDVTAGSIRQAASEWGGSLRAIKQCTRAGMGQCQGRICEATVVELAIRLSGRTAAETGRDTVRQQIKPVSLSALSER